MPLYLDLRQIIYVLSDALDLVGVEDREHGKRVAFIAAQIAQEAGIGARDADDLFHAALVHDCGVSSTREHQEITTKMNPGDEGNHCVRGSELLRQFKPLMHLAPLVRYHHHRWETLKAEDLPTSTARIANCIYLADRVDTLCHRDAEGNLLLERGNILDNIAARRGRYFAPQLVDALLKVAAAEAFWLTLASQPLRSYLDQMARMREPVEIDVDQMKQLAAIFAQIVDAKSPFTAEHSRGVARLAHLLAQKSGLPEGRCDLVEVAGLLHDLGKLVVPDQILNKPGPLDDTERAVIMGHTFYTFQILARIERFDEVAQWAAFHHETLSGNGYPFHHDANSLSLESRIMAVADVFQALAQNRPYRASLPGAKILSILDEMVAENKLDGDVVRLASTNLPQCMEVAVGEHLAA